MSERNAGFSRQWIMLLMVHVRPATPADLEMIVAFNAALAEETERLRLDSGILRDGVRALLEGRAPGRYWAAELNGRGVGQLLVTFEWSDWRNCMVWWIQSVHVAPEARRHGVFRALYDTARREAQAAGAGGLRLYVDVTNTRAQAVYAAVGMNGDHYRVFEDMFAEPERGLDGRSAATTKNSGR
jgi:ribosomal protein S18 acetylase RimI-like enzyme